MLMLGNEPADQWLSVLNHGNHGEDGYMQEYFKMEEVKLVLAEAGLRKHTAAISAHMHLVCGITHECHSNIC